MTLKFEYDNVPVIKTTAGDIKGYCFDDTYTFKGIPYAYADRFQMPVAPKPWKGVLDTTSYGYVCPLMMQDNPTGEMLVPHMYWPQDEHCQSVNIWTQALENNAKKPVLVWLHGGGYFAGSSIEQLAYDGANMSKEGDVVVVSLNHRLNILGFMDLSDFGEKYKNSANAGLADIVAALQWIKENISEFGGDPDNITLFGQSGGGMKITALMQIPAAKGLFTRGIVMSGVAGSLLPPSVGNGRAIVTAMLDELKIPVKEVDKLATIPHQMLYAAYGTVMQSVAMKGEYIGNSPRVDDYYLGEPQVSGYTEQAKHTPLIVGTVFGEFSGFAPSPFNKQAMSKDEMMAVLKELYGDRTEEAVQAFEVAYPDKKIIDLLHVDSIFRPESKVFVDTKAEYREAPTYCYEFTLDFPCQNGKPAWHCSDIPFVFHNVDKVPVANIPGVSDELEEVMFKAVIAFARTGNPNHEGLPQWDAAVPGNMPTMIFDKTCAVRHNFDDKLLQIMKEVLPPFSLEAMMAGAGGDVQH